MNPLDAKQVSDSAVGIGGAEKAISELWPKEEWGQIVITVPDAMNTDPIDLQWINKNSPFKCRINVLGKPMAHERFRIPEERYRELIFAMITAGIKVIPAGALAETNAKYLEAHPDAVGIRTVYPPGTKR
jgi:hypothetical protein